MCADQPAKDKDQGTEKRNSRDWRLRWFVGAFLAVIGGLLTYAIEVQNWRLAQFASITGVILVVAGLTVLAGALSSAATQTPGTTSNSADPPAEKRGDSERSMWLTRLVCVAGIGMAAILLYAVQYTRWTHAQVASTASIGFVAAGAAWLVGALLGFLFGIPHTRQTDAGRRKSSGDSELGASGSASPPDSESPYEPSTSLEQISDWLTKIIVGVGLTQLSKIPGKLDLLAAYIAAGMDQGSPNKAFALSIVIYFSVCGFLFGYLWARLYMMEAFRAADLKRVKEQISHQMLDLQARDLIESHLDLGKHEVPVQVLRDAILRASDTAKAAIFSRAEEAREEQKYSQTIARRTKPIFRALADSDTGDLYHSNHALLGYVHQDLGEWDDSIKELTKAIDIRNRLRRRGWRYYEFKRAVARIKQDVGSGHSAPETKDQILADLREARGDAKYIDRIHNDPEIQGWLNRNNLTEADIAPR